MHNYLLEEIEKFLKLQIILMLLLGVISVNFTRVLYNDGGKLAFAR